MHLVDRQLGRFAGGLVVGWVGESGCYLGVVGRNLLIQLLVLLDGCLQLGGGRGQRSLGAGLNPAPHSGQKLQEPSSFVFFEVVSLFNCKNTANCIWLHKWEKTKCAIMLKLVELVYILHIRLHLTSLYLKKKK